MTQQWTIKEITYNSSEYNQEINLRDKVLRVPLGMSICNEKLEGEDKDFHIGAFIEEELVGILVLTRLADNKIKMRQVAVDEQHRSKKIGSALVEYAENFAKEKGFTLIVLNARKAAVPFYKKLNYEIVSDEFIEVSIPHYKMQKVLK